MTATRVTIAIPTYNRASMLRGAIESVLSQSCPDFRLIVSDNASSDDTRDVVESFGDPRIDYISSEHNVGMIGNINRLIDRANTEFLVLLPDDDFLYPGYVEAVLDVLDRYPRVGVVHTAFDLVDRDSLVLERNRRLLDTSRLVSVESGHEFLKRSMRTTWAVCFSSAIYRRHAIVEAGGLRDEEEPFADVPMWMRIALDWDFAFVSQPLAAIRVHESSATAALGSFVGGQIDVPDRNQILRDRRRAFLATGHARISRRRFRIYRGLTERTFRDEKIRTIANGAGATASWSSASVMLLMEIRRDPRVLSLGRTWRLVLAHLGGRQVRRLTLQIPRQIACRPRHRS